MALFAGQLDGGVAAALRQLHKEVNKWQASGEVAVRSVIPNPDDFLGDIETNFLPRLRERPGPKVRGS